MGKIVYLLGAGASYGERDGVQTYTLTKKINGRSESTPHSCPHILSGLPIISELPQRIDFVLHNIWKILNSIPENDIHRLQFEYLANHIEWMQTASSKHTTIDTFAKKLWITHQADDYTRLKHYMSVYFMLEQMLGKPDPRYDAFFAAILGDSIDDLPNNISIISWNYDCQIELAFADYLKRRDLETIHQHLRICPKNLGANNTNNKFNIIKLNGSALLYDIDTQSIFDPFYKTGGMTPLGYISTLPMSASNIKNLLSFAWEHVDAAFEQCIINSIQDAETLVVIGYSFPFFNRRIDRFLFNHMSKLKKVYIQDRNPNNIAESITNLFEQSPIDTSKIQIEKRDNLDQFFLPPEL